MKENLNALYKLMEELQKLPGIGPKAASRLAFFILKQLPEDAIALAEAIIELKKNIRYCSICWNITAADPCPICQDPGREKDIICVVEQPQELIAIENTGEYQGLYHVLMGAISPINNIGPDDLTIPALLERIDRGGIREIIIAANATNDGETTAVYLLNELKNKNVKISRIAQGLPVGSNLEHVDSVTMIRALKTRRPLN